MLTPIMNARENYAQSLVGINLRGVRLGTGNDSTSHQRMGASAAQIRWRATAHLVAVILAAAALYLFLSASNAPLARTAAFRRGATIAAQKFIPNTHLRPVRATALVRFTR
jgi:hypothetical protein